MRSSSSGTTGANVSVRIGQPAAETEVLVEFLSGKVTNGSIKVAFPEQSENAIYELVATVAFTDTLGITGEVQHRVWSHFLSGTQNELVEKILPAIPRLIGVSNSDLVAASKFEHSPDERRIAKDAQLRHARMVRLLAMHP